MADIFKGLLRLLRSLFAQRSSDEAWIDTAVESLTPRELKLRQTARIYQGAAAVYAIIVLLVALLALLLADSQPLAELLLMRVTAPVDTLLLLALAGLGANLSALLLLAVGALAQEWWTLMLALALLVANLLALLLLGFTPALLALAALLLAARHSLSDLAAYHSNPVMVKELRGRMRGVRAFAIITIFLVLMGSFTVLLYLLQLPVLSGSRTIVTGELGRLLFLGIVGIELMLIIFIVPALTAGAVTGERERMTYDLLQTTLLPAPTFIVGKLESALGYIFLLLLSAIPLQSIAFLFGGVSETEVLLAFIILITTALLLGAMGLYFSTLTERTFTATVRVYTIALGLAFGLPVLSLLLLGQSFGRVIGGLAVGASSATLETVLIYVDMLVSSLNPITAAYYSQQILIDHQTLGLLDVQLRSTGATIPVLSPWILLAILYLGLAALFILLSVRHMRRSG